MYRRASRQFFSTSRAIRNKAQTGTVPPTVQVTPKPATVPVGGPKPAAQSAGNSQKKKTHRFRNFVLSSTLLIGTFYGAGVYFSLDNDTVYDAFTQYAPLGTTLVSLAEDLRLRSRVYQPDKNETLQIKRNTVVPDHVSVATQRLATSTTSKPKVEAAASDSSKKATASSTPSTGSAPAASVAKPKAPEVATIAPPATAASLPVISAPNDLDPSLTVVVDSINAFITSVNSKSNLSDLQIKNLVGTLQDVSSKISELRITKTADVEKQLSEQAERFAKLQEAQISDLVADFENGRRHMLDVYNKRLAKEIEATKKAVVAEANNRLQGQYVSLTTDFTKRVEELVETERDGRLSRLEELSSNINELQQTVASTGEAISGNDSVVNFYTALGQLQNVLAGEATPLRAHLTAIKRSLPNDPLVVAALEAIPDDVRDYGVLSHSQLAARFALITPEIRRSSLIPENAGVAGHVGSWLLSGLLVKKSGMPLGDDIESVLARTETLLSQGKVVDAVAEVNSLKGWPREIADDWLREGRKRGEVEFVVNTLAEEGRLSTISQN